MYLEKNKLDNTEKALSSITIVVSILNSLMFLKHMFRLLNCNFKSDFLLILWLKFTLAGIKDGKNIICVPTRVN